ncbi:hypothetical protein [Streptomyces sp. NPDC101178]|uniref:hypothetical protein n=1 Tax=Streptomyces sp. NPDC101178 TaxID=3366124 RepID=UPI003800A16C
MRPGPAQRTRSVLAALVLAVLTVLGGAPAAGAALPTGGLAGLASTAANPPNTRAPAPQTDRTAHSGNGPHHDLRRTRHAPAAAGGRNARDQQPNPHRSTVRTGPTGPHAHALLPERSPSADPTSPTPRAGISRAHLTGHAPPPSYEGLLPRPPGPLLPRGRIEQPTAAHHSTGSGRGGRPGVRGPPNSTTAGHPAVDRTGHRSRCSADPASRPR